MTSTDDTLILDAVARFLERDVKPHVRELEDADTYPHEIVAKMRELGLFGATIAPEYGGLGLSTASYARIVELVSGVWMSVSGIFNSHLIMAAAVSFLFLMSGLDLVVDFFRGWLPGFLVEAVASMSFLNHFTAITKGVIDLRDLIFFGSLVALSLFINVMLIDLKKAE